ncbi:ATP phosphoribosyltransferase regulatory subunit [Chrysiogenes arsenatis]|uniref:ATP phosphoribosyltransferase regulatory subunit n=1 Tax=Chrysiogenes arsenatis TaxID=309797 RepID=UPI0004010142|nr:ATP phosphoribosyltransferase regulatory subunit [Chrysiogenes arsenatis]
MPHRNEPRDIPRGFLAYTDHRAKTLAAIQHYSLELFAQWGYQRVYTPSLEYEDVVCRALSTATLADTYRIIDTNSGRVLLLRPDYTPGVARAYAASAEQLGAFTRLCYSGPVFRAVDIHEGNQAENIQVGCEFIGCDSLVADREILHLAMAAIQQILPEEPLHIVIGHGQFIAGILQAFDIDTYSQQQILQALHKKDIAELQRAIDASGTQYSNRQVLLMLPELTGGIEVIARARTLVRNSLSLQSLDELEAFVQQITCTGEVTIDLTELSCLDYYTGCYFEIFSATRSLRLAGGGRYDSLLEKYACKLSAVGFAVYANALVKCAVQKATPLADTLVVSRSGDTMGAAAAVDALRREGKTAFWVPVDGTLYHRHLAVNLVEIA